MTTTKTRGPQHGYFDSSWLIPGPHKWTLRGHSRALERTGFFVPELSLMLDAGVDLPTQSSLGRPAVICITHGHIDHMNALPMLLRHVQEGDLVEIFAPAPILFRLRQYTQLSWAVKVDQGVELPVDYAGPPESDCLICMEATSTTTFEDVRRKKWHAVVPGTVTNELMLGKKKKNIPIVVHTLALFHNRCTSVGYLFCTPAGTKKQLRSDLVGSTKQETAQNVKEARQRGEEINVSVETPEVAHFAFVLDTTIDALIDESSHTASRILSCPVVIIECTYLEDSKQEEAVKRGHIWWGALLPFVKNGRNNRDNGLLPKTWVLVHFSLRYSDDDIVSFFEDEQQSRIRLCPVGEENSTTAPPDLVLWLDSGPRELWIE